MHFRDGISPSVFGGFASTFSWLHVHPFSGGTGISSRLHASSATISHGGISTFPVAIVIVMPSSLHIMFMSLSCIFVFIRSICPSNLCSFQFNFVKYTGKDGRAIVGCNSIAGCISPGHESQDECTENQRHHARLQGKPGWVHATSTRRNHRLMHRKRPRL